MGSDGEFEFRRQELEFCSFARARTALQQTKPFQELAHMSERNVAEVSDEEVVKSYEDSTATGVLCS